MKVLSGIAETRAALSSLRPGQSTTVGLVPTMGALHAGHLSLVRAARASCDITAVSIFVNPTQFGPNEDLALYPRTFRADCELLEAEGVDVLFAPSLDQMYPNGGLGVFVDPGELGSRLDGRSRPGHFRGVATVVSKLFHILQPSRAFFGQKDAAQVAVLRAMVRDLDLPVELVVCPTVRDGDGLALSSRNRFLSPEQRLAALALPHALRCAQDAASKGTRDANVLLQCMHNHLTSPQLRLDYVEVVDAGSLVPQQRADRNTLLAVAAWVGDTRLIDNLPLRDTLEQVQS